MPEEAPGKRRPRPPPPKTWWQRILSDRVVVHDESMVPTLRPGDRLYLDRQAYRGAPPEVGDIVVFMDTKGSRLWLIKRVAGVGPGRFWKTRSGLVPADSDTGKAKPPSGAIEMITLPEFTFYAAGDAPAARDSREFGPVPFGNLIGRAYYRYAPADRERAL